MIQNTDNTPEISEIEENTTDSVPNEAVNTKEVKSKVQTAAVKMRLDQKEDFDEMQEKRGDANKHAIMDRALYLLKEDERLKAYDNELVIQQINGALEIIAKSFEMMDNNNKEHTRSKLVQAQEVINKYASEKDDALTQLNSLKDSVAEYKGTIETLSNALKDKEVQLGEQIAWRKNHEEKLKTVEKEKGKLEAELIKKTDFISSYVDEVQDLKKEIDEIKLQRDNLERVASGLEREMDERVENEVRSKLEDTMADLKSKTADIEQKGNELNQKDNKIKELEDQLALKEAELDLYKGENDSLNQTISSLNIKMNEDINTKVQALTKELNERNKGLEGDLENKENSIKKLEKQVNELNDKVEDYDDLKQELTNKKAEIDGWVAKDREQQTKIIVQSSQIEELKEQIKSLRNRYEADINSLRDNQKMFLADIRNSYKQQDTDTKEESDNTEK
ncbi:MAG: hypothetical protein J6D47_10465 [Peptostreptococcaceae bacterium]|nr:hypothetical protein [Peptostreptococcaceae bacterium]